MKKTDISNDNYVEARPIKVDDSQKLINQEKAFLLRVDIAAAVISVLTTSILSSNGQNPFEVFAKLFTIPIGALVLGNIKILTMIKNKEKQNNNDSVGRRL